MPHFLSSLLNCDQWFQEERSQQWVFVDGGAEVCTETLGTETDPLLEAIPCECSAQIHYTWGDICLVPSHRVSLEQFVNWQCAKLYYFPDGSVVKNLPANTGNTGNPGLIPGSEKSSRGGHGNALQNSCLENPMDRGAWRTIVHGVTKSQTELNTHNRHVWYSSVLISIS